MGGRRRLAPADEWVCSLKLGGLAFFGAWDRVLRFGMALFPQRRGISAGRVGWDGFAPV